MAQSKSSRWGDLSGKLGPMVMFVRYGKQYARTHTIPRDPKTPAQLAQRAKLSLVNKCLAPLSQVIKQNFKEGYMAYRSLVGDTIKYFVVGEYPDFSIDYSRIPISEGKVLLPERISAVYHSDSNQVTFTWDAQLPPPSIWSNANDPVKILFLHAPTLSVFKPSGIVKRSHGRVSVELPGEWNSPGIHCWVYLTSWDLQHRSDSQYVNI